MKQSVYALATAIFLAVALFLIPQGAKAQLPAAVLSTINSHDGGVFTAVEAPFWEVTVDGENLSMTTLSLTVEPATFFTWNAKIIAADNAQHPLIDITNIMPGGMFDLNAVAFGYGGATTDVISLDGNDVTSIGPNGLIIAWNGAAPVFGTQAGLTTLGPALAALPVAELFWDNIGGVIGIKYSLDGGTTFDSFVPVPGLKLALAGGDIFCDPNQFSPPAVYTYDGVTDVPIVASIDPAKGTAAEIGVETIYYEDVADPGNFFTTPPTAAGTYRAILKVTGGTLYDDFSWVLGGFVIDKAVLVAADFVYDPDNEEWSGSPIVGVTTLDYAPGVIGAGTITHLRYKDAALTTWDIDLVAGTGTPPEDIGVYELMVSVLDGANYEAIPGWLTIGNFEITKVTPQPKDFEEATNGDSFAAMLLEYDYTGATIPIDVQSIHPGGWLWAATLDVEFEKADGTPLGATEPVDAGDYKIFVTTDGGVYFKPATKLFIADLKINKKVPVSADFDAWPASKPYARGAEVTIDVDWLPALTGTGAISAVMYSDGTKVWGPGLPPGNAPTEAGFYSIFIDVQEGDNYTQKLWLPVGGLWEITKIDPVDTDFEFTPASAVFDGLAHGVTVDLSAAFLASTASGMGDLSSLVVNYYDASTATWVIGEPIDPGVYEVRISLDAGTNFKAITSPPTLKIGDFTIGKATPKPEDFATNLGTFFPLDPVEFDYSGVLPVWWVGTVPTILPGQMGAITTKFTDMAGVPLPGQPVDAGQYKIVIDVDNTGTAFTDITDLEIGLLIINPIDPSSANFDAWPATNPYARGAEVPINVGVLPGVTGMGAIAAIMYSDGVSVWGPGLAPGNAPTEVGGYEIFIDVAAGTNYNAKTWIKVGGVYQITKINPDASDFAFTPASVVTDGTEKGVTVTTSTIGIGAIHTIIYRDAAGVLPDFITTGPAFAEPKPTVAGDYVIWVGVDEGASFNAWSWFNLGTFSLVDPITLTQADFLIGLCPTWDNYDFNCGPQGIDPIDLTCTNAVLNASKDFFFEFVAIAAPAVTPAFGDKPTEPGLYTINIHITDPAFNSPVITGWSFEIYDTKITLTDVDFDLVTPPADFPNYIIGTAAAYGPDFTDFAYVGGSACFDITTDANFIYLVSKDGGATWADNGGKPTDPGLYRIRFEILGGGHFAAANIDGWQFTVAKKTPTQADFILNPALPASFVWDGNPKCIDIQEVAGLVGFGTWGKVFVSYERWPLDFRGGTCPTTIGQYSVWVEVQEGANYTSAALYFGDFFINPGAPLPCNDFIYDNMIAGGYELVYDGQDHGINATGFATITYTGTWEILYNGSPDLPKDVGDYDVTVEFSGDAVYAAGVCDLGSIKITPRPLLVKAYCDPAVVDPCNATFEKLCSVTGFVPGEEVANPFVVAPVLAMPTYVANTVGTFPLVITNKAAVSLIPALYNYEVVCEDGELVVTAEGMPLLAFLYVAIPVDQKYDGKAKEPATVVGVAGMGKITVKYNGKTDLPVNAGAYSVTVDITAGTVFKDVVTGYYVGLYIVLPANAYASNFNYVIPGDLVYNGTQQGGVQVSSDLNVGLITVKYNGSTTVPRDAGTYTVTMSTKTTNYVGIEDLVLGTFTIEKKVVDVVAENLTVEVGAALPKELHVTYEGFVNQLDNEINALDTKAEAAVNIFTANAAGEYVIDFSKEAVLKNTKATNYVLNHVKGTLVVGAPTGLETTKVASLNAYVENGILNINGLNAGTQVRVYTLAGALLNQVTATSDKVEMSLGARGVYVVQTDKGNLRVIY